MPSQTSRPATTASAAATPALTVIILGLLLGLQPLATDMYLPALPSIRTGFMAAVSQAQLTLTAFLLAFGCSQLVWGPLSDRFGRRPILLIGLIGYVLAALGCATSQSIDAFIGWRALGGCALGAVVMCVRAVVRDLYAPHLGAQVMSKALTGLGIVAFSSPIIGSALVGSLGWRATMVAQALVGCATLALVVLKFQESLGRPNLQALQVAPLLRTWLSIVRNPMFLAYNLLSCCTYTALFTYLAASSFTYIDVLGMSRTGYGVMMAINALFYICGTILCRRLLTRVSVQTAVTWAALASLVSATCVGLAAMAELRNLWAYALPFAVFQVAHGVHMPCGQSNAVAPFPQAAGTASALNGVTMMLLAFATGLWLGQHLDGTSTRPMGYGIWFWGTCTAIVAWTLVRRYGRLPASPQ